MCMIIVKPYGTKIPKDHIFDSAFHNPDGFGFYAYGEGESKIYRTTDYENFAATINRYNKRHMFVVAHFRLSTQGLTTEKNVHPFEIKNGWFMAHNGVFLNTPNHKTFSDTYLINEVLRQFDSLDKNMQAVALLFEYLDSSRMVFAKKDEYYIANEASGEWHEKCWYSTDQLFRKPYGAYGYGTSYYGGVNARNYNWDNDYDDMKDYYGDLNEAAEQRRAEMPEMPEEYNIYENATQAFENLYNEEFPHMAANDIFSSMGYMGELSERWTQISIDERRTILDEITLFLDDMEEDDEQTLAALNEPKK